MGLRSCNASGSCARQGGTNVDVGCLEHGRKSGEKTGQQGECNGPEQDASIEPKVLPDAEELGEATFDELVDLVSRELRSGILSVQGKDGEAMRIVLGAGRPVAAAVEEFVRRMRPLVSRAEPLTYEIHAPTGGAVGLLDAEARRAVESF